MVRIVTMRNDGKIRELLVADWDQAAHEFDLMDTSNLQSIQAAAITEEDWDE